MTKEQTALDIARRMAELGERSHAVTAYTLALADARDRQPETELEAALCLFENGWSQVDVVGSRIHFAPCMPHSSSRLIFISKIGHALSKPLAESWEELIGLPMQLHD